MAGLRVDRCVCERVIEGKSRARQHLVESERPSLWDWSAAMIIFGLYNMYLNMSSYVEETASKGPNWISTNTKKPVPTLWLVLTALINHRYKIESWDFWCIKYALMCLMSSEDNLRLRQKLCDVIWKCSRRSEASVNVGYGLRFKIFKAVRLQRTALENYNSALRGSDARVRVYLIALCR